MKILQLVAQTVIGGAETYGWSLAAELARRGHRTLLLGNRRNGPLLDRERPERMEVDALDRRSRLDPRIVSFLVGWIRRFRPDVLHAHNFEASSWARTLGLFFPGLVVVSHVHSGRMVVRHSPRRIRIDRLLFRRADLVVALNQEQERYLIETLRVPPARLRVMENGIDMTRFRPLADGSRDGAGGTAIAGATSRRSVVCVASLTDVKNHAGLLRAWERIAPEHPDVDLVLVGDGNLRPDLESQSAAAGLRDRVRFAGLQKDVLPFLQRASVFVLPSHREALPLSLLEAMATGLPPVASAVGGIPEVVEDGKTGLLVPPGDESVLAASLDRVLSDESLRHEMARNARESVADRFSLAAAAERLEAEYEVALRRRRRGDETRDPDLRYRERSSP